MQGRDDDGDGIADKIDEDGDGSVDFDEFLLLMVKQEKAAEGEEEELVTVFK